ncbi:ABC-2 family transporter permease [Oceanobacillus manasiensis]|uniref:ABC transporter permease n=1 Tax=Oceanobacillus manasiensis TaxID=586413 RepID=UPI0005AAAF15|nr:ABC transporter permease [Oceanobacillus manasiensis]
MMKLFLFEWKKILKKKTTWVLLILSLTATIGIYFFHLSLANNVEQKVINHYDFLINLSLESAEDSRLAKEKAIKEEDEDLIEQATMEEEHYRTSVEKYQSAKKSYVDEEWEVLYQRELDSLETYAYPSQYENAVFIAEGGGEITNFTLRATFEERKYMLDHKIDPFIQNTIYDMYLRTAYEDFDSKTLEIWEEMTDRYGKQGIYYIYQLIQSLYIPIIILLGCFIFGNTLSSETTKKNNGIRFHQVLPLNQTKLFVAKYLTGYLGILLFFMLMIVAPLIVGTLMHGFGYLDYPVLIYDGYTTEDMWKNAMEDTFHFITLQEYLSKTVWFALAMSLLIYSLYYLVSQFSKEPIFNTIIIGVICFVGMQFQHPYNPFSYLDIDKVISHEIQLETWNTDITYITGIMIMLVIGFIFTVGNYIRFRSRRTN